MIVDCIADLHGEYPELDGGDLLIVAGDLSSNDTAPSRNAFYEWIHHQRYAKKVVIAGNHDNYCFTCYRQGLIPFKTYEITYLCDSGTEFKGLKIWGSPWTATFDGINPHCRAFTVEETEEETKWGPKLFSIEGHLWAKWDLIPPDTDILITHSPPYGILDLVNDPQHCGSYHVGSKSLRDRLSVVRPLLHVFGHIHESYGMDRNHLEELRIPGYPIFVNASHVNECYDPVNKPIRIEL